MSLPEQLLLSDILRRRVRCDQGLDHGAGVVAWMHPPVHRLLGWISKPSALGDRRLAWRLNQLRGLSELELFARGEAAVTDLPTVDRLPTLIEAAVLGSDDEPIGQVADAAIDLSSGRILHYLISRSDPRLPGTSRWRLQPDRIVDQQPGRVITGVRSLDDLLIGSEDHCIHQGGQAIHGWQIRRSGIPPHKQLQFRQPPQLIQPPGQPPIAQGGGLANPTEEPMHRGVHPSGHTGSMVKALITANPAAQDVAEQQLLRQGH